MADGYGGSGEEEECWPRKYGSDGSVSILLSPKPISSSAPLPVINFSVKKCGKVWPPSFISKGKVEGYGAVWWLSRGEDEEVREVEITQPFNHRHQSCQSQTLCGGRRFPLTDLGEGREMEVLPYIIFNWFHLYIL